MKGSPALSEFFDLLQSLIGETSEAEAARRANMTPDGRRNSCRDRGIAADARGDLGFEFVEYNNGEELDAFIVFLTQYFCLQVGQSAHLGLYELLETEPLPDEPDQQVFVESFLFRFLSDLTGPDETFRKQLQDIRSIEDLQLRATELEAFLDQNLNEDRFRSAIEALIVPPDPNESTTTDPSAFEMNSFIREYVDKFQAPC